jgi:hypothetical protein
MKLLERLILVGLIFAVAFNVWMLANEGAQDWPAVPAS